jgi:hypothetical protein
MVGVTTTMVPGQHILNAGITTPVSIIGYGTGTGDVGTYLLSNPSSNGVGSAGSPVAFTSTGIGDAGAVAPGPALTIKDLGAGVTFPVTNFSAGTGPLTLSGTFDTSVLDTSGHNTAPTTIQAQVSLTAGGPPVPGCSACAWTNLSGYSATLSSGTLFDWKGQALNIPASAGPLFVSVRAANGTAYATMPSLIKVGLVFDINSEGQGAALGVLGGTANSYFTGLWGQNSWNGAGTGGLDQGPPVLGPWVPAQTIMYAGDRFSILGGGVPVPEGTTVLQQKLTNAFGWPVTQNTSLRDGIGISPETVGNVFQAQTVGLGDGSSSTFCSAAKFCGPTSSPAGVVSSGGPLAFTAASQTGAQITASITGTTLSITNVLIGALQPGAAVSDMTGAIIGSPTLVNCLTGCAPTVGPPQLVNNAQTWTISVNQTTPVASETMRADLGSPPWPGYDIQGISLSFVNGGFGTQLVQAGTFKITVNGTVVCQDTSVFTYNVQGGNCTDSGGHVVTSGWVNYTTGDYGITFSSPPASNAVITASWTNIISPEGNQTPATQRPIAIDFFGNGNPQSGPISSIFAKTPGGSSGHIFAGGISDEGIFLTMGYPLGAIGYTQSVSWLYDTRFPSLIPGQTNTTPFICANYWRSEGAITFVAPAGVNNANRTSLFEQWSEDMCAPSAFPGFIASNVLTLTSAVTGSMWEGEIVGGAGVTAGAYILDLKSGTWGASGSTYDLGGSPADVGSSGSPVAMKNAVFYLGPGPAFYAGPMNDVAVQASTLAATTGQSPHPWNGFAGGRRVASRWAAEIWGGLTNVANASDPTLDRVKADASGCDTSALAAPCFDIGNTFAASHSATIAGAQITVTGGIAAHARPFVVGQLLACSGCTTGRFITSIDVPPTQSTTTGAGEVGQTFHITANGSLLTGPTTETVTAGCSGTAGSGSNCIDLAISINTTNGSYGTAAALATCGENNLNGSAPNYQPPNGTCQTNGIGSLVRNFRIGTLQAMFNGTSVGSPYDDGVDFGATFNQSAAFSCHIVAAKVIQCVKGAAYTLTPTFSVALGQWASGATFVEYGDSVVGTGRIASLMGNVGGQSFPFTPGSGYTNGTFKATAACTSLASGGVLPAVDVTVSGGSIVNVYGSTAANAIGLAIGGGCTFALPAGMGAGSGTAAIGSPIVAPVDGVSGIATYNTDSNMMGDLLYDNSGLPGNPLNSFFANGLRYFEPGLPVHPWGEFLGAAVSG